ncbi:acyl-CoA synthetase [Mycobacterium sp. 050272]|uniref:acyl-CoA synthetase n=1 Tax=Mycobacterium sp. 050272 TaxID=3142488 RepID=UPI003197DDA4
MQERSSPDGGAREKIDEDDHDLLTFGEAGERLRVEISATAARVAELQHLGDRDELATATARLAALRVAAKRNAADPINDANFESFFGYPGKAKRTAPPPASG